jgi:hypothetical protein
MQAGCESVTRIRVDATAAAVQRTHRRCAEDDGACDRGSSSNNRAREVEEAAKLQGTHVGVGVGARDAIRHTQRGNRTTHSSTLRRLFCQCGMRKKRVFPNQQ